MTIRSFTMGVKIKSMFSDELRYATGVHRSGKIGVCQVIVAFQFAGISEAASSMETLQSDRPSGTVI